MVSYFHEKRFQRIRRDVITIAPKKQEKLIR